MWDFSSVLGEPQMLHIIICSFLIQLLLYIENVTKWPSDMIEEIWLYLTVIPYNLYMFFIDI